MQVTAVEKWYFSLGSRYDLYETVGHLRDVKNITEDEVYYDSCLTWGANPSDPTEFVMQGFDGKTVLEEITPLDLTGGVES